MDQRITHQIASDKIIHVASLLFAVGRELDMLAGDLGEELWERVAAAYPEHERITTAARKLEDLARSMEPPDCA